MKRLTKIRKFTAERGFTLLETMLVVGLSTLIAVGIVAALIEGLDTLETISDSQNVEFGHQRVMNSFITDVKNATWFYNGSTHSDDGSEIDSLMTSSTSLIMGYEGAEGSEVWIKYGTRPGILNPFEPETYLIRTVATNGPVGNGASLITTGVANLEFVYYDNEGREVFDLTEIRRVIMTISLVSGGAVIQRSYDVALRNPNLGVKTPISDMSDIENEAILK